MKTYAVAVAVGMACLGFLAVAYGQETPAPTPAPAPERRAGRGQFMAGPSLGEALSKLELTIDKQRQVNDVLTAEQDRVKKNAEEMKKVQAELRKAQEADDSAAIDAAHKKIGELRQAATGQKESMKQLKEILSQEEFAKLEKDMAGQSRMTRMAGVLRGLDRLALDLKQQAALNEAVDQAIEKIKKSLTEDQRKTLEQAIEAQTRRPGPGAETRRGGAGGEERMTPEQRQKVTAIRQDYRAKIEAAPADQKDELRHEMEQKVREVMRGE